MSTLEAKAFACLRIARAPIQDRTELLYAAEDLYSKKAVKRKFEELLRRGYTQIKFGVPVLTAKGKEALANEPEPVDMDKARAWLMRGTDHDL